MSIAMEIDEYDRNLAETSLITVKGIVALVTGGCSGLGRGTVEKLISLGAKGVIAFDLKFADKFMANNVVSVVGNVVNEDDVKRALEQCKTQFGRLDVVVNCAGIFHNESIYNDSDNKTHSLDTFRNVLEVNTIGTFNVYQLSIALISENRAINNGVIINTASIAGLNGSKATVAYAASKAAVIGMTKPIARCVANLGIRCVTIAPGLFYTPLEFAHLVQTIIENPMFNGQVIRLDGALSG